MKNSIIFLIIFVLSLLESTIIPLNLALAAVIAWTALVLPDQGLVTAFLAGVILGFLTGAPLGLTSLIFLTAVLPIYLYRNRFQADKLRFLLPYSFLTIFVVGILDDSVSFFPVVFGALTIVVLLPAFRILKNITQEEIHPKLSF